MPQRGRLRVALLGYRSAPFSGGQGVYLRYLSQALTAMGHQVTVISGPPYPDLVSGVALVKLPSLDLYARESMMVRPVELRDPLAQKRVGKQTDWRVRGALDFWRASARLVAGPCRSV